VIPNANVLRRFEYTWCINSFLSRSCSNAFYLQFKRKIAVFFNIYNTLTPNMGVCLSNTNFYLLHAELCMLRAVEFHVSFISFFLPMALRILVMSFELITLWYWFKASISSHQLAWQIIYQYLFTTGGSYEDTFQS